MQSRSIIHFQEPVSPGAWTAPGTQLLVGTPPAQQVTRIAKYAERGFSLTKANGEVVEWV